MKIGLVGLGAMGRAMAHNLLKAGHELNVYNSNRSRADELARDGAKVADSPAISADVVITMLSDDHAVEGVFDALVSALPKGAIHISMSTISVDLSQRMPEANRQKGQHYVAAPVFGRPEAAEAAKLFVVAAGANEAVRRCQPVFDAVGQKTFVMGEHPIFANVVKLTGNFLIACTLECFGEAFALARKYGLDPQQYLDVLTGTLFSAPYQKNYGAIIANQAYEPAGFRLPLGLKDVRLALAAAEAKQVPMPVASILRDQYLTALAQGWENSDWSAIARLAAHNAGLK